MSEEQYRNALAELSGGEEEFDEDRVRRLTAPFDDFFNDVFLVLVFQSGTACHPKLTSLRDQLTVATDPTVSTHQRARAALAVGRNVRERYRDSYTVSSSLAQSNRWFVLADDWDSVVGSHELAQNALLLSSQELRFSLDKDVLPVIGRTKESRVSSCPVFADPRAFTAWLGGARCALRHLASKFSGWDKEDFDAAMTCIICFLALRENPFDSDLAPIDERHAQLPWIVPLWNSLIEAAARVIVRPDKFVRACTEQQRAVLLALKKPIAVPLGSSGVQTSRSQGANEAIVIRGTVPTSSDRDTNEYLTQFEVLRSPLPLFALPNLDGLRALQMSLINEFPWAQDAIALVLRDLIVRKRFGASSVGIEPVLLVGEPGNGKTRFAQRLCELLGVPNTVINLAGMGDAKVLKGTTRGWASNRSSRIVEFMMQSRCCNPFFILDEIDKTGSRFANDGDPRDALLDLLEPTNAHRYQDVFLMTECDLSKCSYIATSNSLSNLPAPLLSRMRPVLFPSARPEDVDVVVQGVLRDLHRAMNLPEGSITLDRRQIGELRDLSPRRIRHAVMEILAKEIKLEQWQQH